MLPLGRKSASDADNVRVVASVRVEKTLRTPIEVVFEYLSDHARYDRFRIMTRSALLREGESERNGVGALRGLSSGPVRFEEEITRFERPTRMDYVIREVNMPVRHEGGSITLTSDARGATDVLWVSSWSTNVGPVSGPVGAFLAAWIKRGFIWLLNDIDRLAAKG